MNQATLPLQDKWIVITRPEHQSENIKHILEQAGAHVILFPLLAISPPDNLEHSKHCLENITNYDLVIFISPNAVEEGLKWLNAASLKEIKVASVGAKTSAQLTQHRIQVAFSPKENFNSEALLALPEMKSLGSGKKIAILRGEGGRDFLKNKLEQQGCKVDYIDLYKRICPQKELKTLRYHYENKHLDIILITSGTSIDHLFSLKEQNNMNDWLDDICLLVGSERIKQQVLNNTSHRGMLLASSNPSDENLYQKLLEWSKNT